MKPAWRKGGESYAEGWRKLFYESDDFTYKVQIKIMRNKGIVPYSTVQLGTILYSTVSFCEAYYIKSLIKRKFCSSASCEIKASAKISLSTE